MKVALIYNSFSNVRGSKSNSLDEIGVINGVKSIEESLKDLNIDYSIIPIGNIMKKWLEEILEYKPDVVFNLCEAVDGNSRLEMNIPALLDLTGIPYTGSSSLTLGICQNKSLTKDILLSNGIKTPNHSLVKNADEIEEGNIIFPAIVKPMREDGSLGINTCNVVTNISDLIRLVNEIIIEHHQPALIEEYIDGRELNVAIIGNNPPIPLPISEIVFPDHYKFKIVSYDAKWVEDSDDYKNTRAICPSLIDEEIRDKVFAIANKAYELLGCRDYARVDIRLRGDIPYVLEVNPNPDISQEVGLTRSLKAAGISYNQFIKEVISYALQRGNGYT